jgi:hypothetical protein
LSSNCISWTGGFIKTAGGFVGRFIYGGFILNLAAVLLIAASTRLLAASAGFVRALRYICQHPALSTN